MSYKYIVWHEEAGLHYAGNERIQAEVNLKYGGTLYIAEDPKRHPYEDEVESFLVRLIRNDVKLLSVNDGEEWVDCTELGEMLETILSVDESWMKVQIGDKQRVIFFVLGNGTGEAVCDYTCDDLLDKLTAEHYKQWGI